MPNIKKVSSNKNLKTVPFISKYGNKIFISADKASKAALEPLYQQAENQNEENIAEHTLQNIN